MKDEEVIKALECCKYFNFNACGECPYLTLKDDIFTCLKVKQNDVSKLIKRLMAEKEILSRNADNAFQDGLNENRDLFKTEIEPEITANTIKEFASDFRAVASGIEDYETKQIVSYSISADDFEGLVKERLNETNKGGE